MEHVCWFCVGSWPGHSHRDLSSPNSGIARDCAQSTITCVEFLC